MITSLDALIFIILQKKSNEISYKNKKFNTKNVKIHLDEIPFIKLRNITESIIPNKNQSFTSLINVAQEKN